MNNKKQTESVTKKSNPTPKASSGAAPTDTVAQIQAVEKAMPVGTPLDKKSRKEKRGVLRRTSTTQVNLVLADAQQSGGSVGGVAIDSATAAAQQTQAARLRVGAAAARRIALSLSDSALTLDAGVAQLVLSAVGALEAISKLPEGEQYVAKVAELRAAARKRKKGSKATANPPTTAPAVPVLKPAGQ